MAINTVTLSGCLTADPELRYTQKGTAVISGRIAVLDGWGEHEKTHFFDYNAWMNTAEYMAKYASKGTLLTISGKLTQSSWINEKGEPRQKTVVQVNEVVLPRKTTSTQEEPYHNPLGREITFDDSDLPF